MDLKENIDKVVDSLIPKNLIKYTKTKYVNDPLWGSIDLHPFEQTIIDLPLLQRLRYIRQTGFTYFTYPTASHCRFEHSLGVMHIAQRIFNVIKNKRTDNLLDKTSLNRIRLACLLHDTGHSAFSHTHRKNFMQN